jgi:hypothetical protein
MTWPSVAALLYFVLFAQAPSTAGGPSLGMQTVWTGCKIVQFALPVVWLGLCQRQSLRLGRPTTAGLLLGFLFSVLVVAAGLGSYFAWLRDTLDWQPTIGRIRTRVEALDLANPAAFVLLAAFLSVIHALLEEYYWRWFVFGELRRLTLVPAALGLSGLAFMAHHVIVLTVLFPGLFLTLVVPLSAGVAAGGLFWAWLYHQSGSIYSCWLSHLLIDAGIMVVGYDLLFLR